MPRLTSAVVIVLALNGAIVDAVADMLPTFREEARQRAVEAARKELKAAEEKVARLVAGCAKQR